MKSDFEEKILEHEEEEREEIQVNKHDELVDETNRIDPRDIENQEEN